MKVLLLTLILSSQAWAAPKASRWVSVNSSILSSLRSTFHKPQQIKMADSEVTVMELSERETVELSSAIHQNLNRCGGFKAHDSLEEASNSRQPSLNLFSRPSANDYSLTQSRFLTPLLANVSEQRIRKTIIDLSSFETRYYQSEDGARSAKLVVDSWKELAKRRNDIKVEYVRHRKWLQPSVVLTIQGSQSPNEIVILGGHLDSIASDENFAPGADDNASGIASMTEVLKLMLDYNYKPKKTIQLMAYAAEEVGLLGSGEISKTYKASRKNVIGVLQLDMTLFKGTHNKDIVLISDYTNRKQNEFLGKLIDEYVKVPWGYSRCGYGCSDHASWSDQGYPASFAFESEFDEHNPHIHSSQDTLANAGGDASHSVRFTKLALSFLVELSK